MSDGLVQIKNARVDGGPRAFVHRAHSGDYGIVNSEEGYQNLRRFLFGNVRADAFLDIQNITLPPAVEQLRKKGKRVRASYHVEVIGRVRGTRWDLHRRVTNEGSSIFGSFDDLTRGGKRIQLASSFLSNEARVEKRRRGLGFSLDLGIQVPEYRVDGVWFKRDHFEGGYLYREKINLEAGRDGNGWWLRYGFDSKTPNRVSKQADREDLGNGKYRFSIPVQQNTKPGVDAVLEIETRRWNEGAR